MAEKLFILMLGINPLAFLIVEKLRKVMKIRRSWIGVDTMVDEDAWQLPTEGFQLRHELPDRSDAHSDGISAKDLNRSDRNRSGSLGPDDHSYEDVLRFGSLATQLCHGPSLDFTDLIHGHRPVLRQSGRSTDRCQFDFGPRGKSAQPI